MNEQDNILTAKDVRNHLRQNMTYKLAKMHVTDVLKVIFILPWVFIWGTLVGLVSGSSTSNYNSHKKQDQSNNREPRRRKREKVTVVIRKKRFFEDTFW